MSDELNTSPVPPPRKNILWVECLKGGQRHRLLIYSPAVIGVFFHWTGKASKPCYKNHKLCEGGHDPETMKWRGYLHCWSYERGKPVFLQLTDTAVQQLWLQVSDKSALRGLSIHAARSKADNGRMSVQVDRYGEKGPDNLPPPLDVKESLLKLWKVPKTNALLNSRFYGGEEELPSRNGELGAP